MTQLLVCYGYVCPQTPDSDYYYVNPEHDCHALITVLHLPAISQAWQDLTFPLKVTSFNTRLGMGTTEVDEVATGSTVWTGKIPDHTPSIRWQFHHTGLLIYLSMYPNDYEYQLFELLLPSHRCPRLSLLYISWP
jgi:hypothetical protein